MKQPVGFVDKTRPNHVCLLHKALYGLKQSLGTWFDKFSNYLLEFGFICSKPDPSLFVYTEDKDVTILLLFVGDMVIIGNNLATLTSLLIDLHKHFRMKDLGQLHYFLGIQAQFHSEGLFLSQQKYAEDLLVIAGMIDYAPMPTQLPLQLDRVPDQQEAFPNPTYFRSLVGKLQYLTLTRPIVSDFSLLKRILIYVKGTMLGSFSPT